MKLLSPIIIRRTFIYKHIHIDTNALVQLLMTKEDIAIFANDYYRLHNIKLNLRTKCDLGSKFEKIVGRLPNDLKEDFFFQQEYWKYLCNFQKCKKSQNCLYDKKRKLYFGNSIVTDGSSISFSIVNEDELKKKTFKTRTLKKKV